MWETGNAFFCLTAFFLTCILTTTTVQADDRKEIERHLKKEYQGKTVILRNFYSGKRLRYDSAGKLLEGGAPGPWTLYGRIKIKKIKLRQDRLEIKGERFFLAYKEKEKNFKAIGDQKVKIEVGMQSDSMNEHSLRQAMTKIFLSGGDRLADVVPSYWKSFFLRDKEQLRLVLRPGQARTTEKEQEMFRIDGEKVSAPECLYCPSAEYSEEARKAEYQGTVRLSFIVGETGHAREIRIRKPVGMGLDDALVHAVQYWRFKPAERFGNPVSVYMAVEVTFHLY